MLSEVYLSLGSNLGDRRKNIISAVKFFKEESVGLEFSGFYETVPEMFLGQPPFLNVACRIWTQLDPFELLQKTQKIQSEIDVHRRVFINGPRILDIDIVFYGSFVLRTPKLVVPHPSMAEREFVLAPLVEIAPDYMHPVLNESTKTLLVRLREKSSVRMVRRMGISLGGG